MKDRDGAPASGPGSGKTVVSSKPRSVALPPRYVPLSPLGRGGGGEVWCVRDRLTDRTVALKVLREGASEREVLALVREAAALSGVEGLGVPRVLRFGSIRGSRQPYLLRELVEGESLADLMNRGGDPMAHLSSIAQAAEHLTRLHRALLLHGDIKPANIIVGSDGTASLVDLGLAATWREGGAKPEGLTPRYAAPELFQGAPLTPRVEVFALGATIAEVIATADGGLPASLVPALEAIVRKATAEDPTARYPSVDELSSALRHAARLPEPAADLAVAWPVVGLDAPSNRLLAQIAALPAGGGLVVAGPRLSGRSSLLRRVAWSLGVEGRAVAWVESEAADVREALRVELAGAGLGETGESGDPAGVVVLVDDAERLDAESLARLDALRERGGRLVFVAGSADPPPRFPGRTFELFAMTPLEGPVAGELVRRAIPSLSDAVVQHVVARAEGWPGRLRAIVTQLARAPVVVPADVDRLLDRELAAAGDTTAQSIHELLDRGHFEDAADLLERRRGDRSPTIAIARARLATNRGEVVPAVMALTEVEGAVLGGDDTALKAMWLLTAGRASLRAGKYPEAERRCLQVETTLAEAASGPHAVPARARTTFESEAAAVAGLARSYEGRHDEATEVLERAVAAARSIDDARMMSLALGSLGFALQRADRLNEAHDAYEEALKEAEKAGDAGSLSSIRLNLATIAKTRGDLAGALPHFEAAVDLGRRSGRTATLRGALLNLANLDLYLGRLQRARVSIDALAAQRDELTPQARAQLLSLEAEHAVRSGEFAEADGLCAACAEAYEQLGRRADAAEARLERVLCGALAPSPDPAALKQELERARALLEGTPSHKPLMALATGRVLALQGDEDGARRALADAVSGSRQASQRDVEWRALDARANLEGSAGQAYKAKRDREAALLVLEEIAERLPRDLREVYWNDARRRALRASFLLELQSSQTIAFEPSSTNQSNPASFGVRTKLPHAPTDSSPPGVTSRSVHGAASIDRLARVLEINREIAGEHDVSRLLERVTDHAVALLRAERGFVLLKPRRTDSVHTDDARFDSELVVHAVHDPRGEEAHGRFSRSIADRVVKSGEPVVTASAREDSRMAGYLSVHQLSIQAVACVPIRSRSEVIGALYLETRLSANADFAAELPTLSAFADQVAIAIETARLVSENERRTRELATANAELEAARKKLEELLGHRTAQLAATRRDLRSARAVIRGHFGYEGLVGTSEAMRRVYALIDRIKDTDVPVLIIGESGTGKEIVARAIHQSGPRAKKPFLGLNCGAIPEHLLESELFGHVKGAFTGADRDRKGLFREATEGTILLDEIGEMPQKMQAGLLRVLQERVVRPVGGAREEPVDTRVIAATHRDLAQMVEERIFREDLYYRLHVIQVTVPPLRERIEDVPVLIDHFLGIFAARYSRERRSVSRAALKRLAGYHWPGNVRQLENVLLNAWVLSDQPELEPDDFELPEARSSFRPAAALAGGSAAVAGGGDRGDSGVHPVTPATSLDAHRATERDRILHALTSCNWNRVKAAQLVGLPRRTFYRRLKEYGIQ